MDGYRRYAVYWAPEQGSALARFASAWLGWDADAGCAVPRPEVPGLPVPLEALTEAPRRYGFHGTLKPPFRLAQGRTPSDLDAAVAALAAETPDFAMPPLRLAGLGRFLALVPAEPSPALDAAAAACVTRLDCFRAPMPPEERARRAAGLGPRGLALLDRWGYGHVLEAFRFHLTLTGPLDEATRDAVAAALLPVLAPELAEPRRFGALSIFAEAEAGPFRIVRRHALGGTGEHAVEHESND